MPSLQSFIDRMVYYCRDVSVGYSQADRWDVRPGGNCDCSSLVITCLREAGFDTGTASYTGNMSAQLTARGWVRLSPYVSKQPGDILLNDAYHVAAMINNYQLAQASISETGGVNGMDGDQTGRETNISNYYDYPWNAVLRWNGDTMATTQEIAAAVGSYTYGNGDTVYNYVHYASDNSGAARKDAALARAYLTPRFLGARDDAARYLWLPGRKVIPLYEMAEMSEMAGDLKNIYGQDVPTVLYATKAQLDYAISILNDQPWEERAKLIPGK